MVKDRSRRLGGCVPRAVPSHSSPHRLEGGWEPGQGEKGREGEEVEEVDSVAAEWS